DLDPPRAATINPPHATGYSIGRSRRHAVEVTSASRKRRGQSVMNRRRVGWGVLLFSLLSQAPTTAEQPSGATAPIDVRTGTANGAKLQYLTAGQGPAILLLHGYAETSTMWRPLIPRLAQRFRVIAPDLPGIGGADIPSEGLDMAGAARRIHDLVKALGIDKSVVVGHDIGLMVAYA